MPNLPIILLAAGESSRMGSPKPLLLWKGKILIEFQLKNLLSTHQQVFVVLGANAHQIIPFINATEITVSINEDWKEGMSTSIAFAVKKVMDTIKNMDGVIITAIDQPLVDTKHLNTIIKSFKANEKQIIVSESDNGWRGVPALFDKCYLQELAKLKGDSGAKIVVRNHSKNVQTVYAGNKLADMDTPEIYQQLKSAAHQ
ncbi:MAG: 4-diphosphocytidyl-2C-methyl-D-erythritol synthase [Bacteroidetes bacterium HGW-Bacteroidetes-18]|nr:MAG: 4-diphosphocytidyl-2C-methyl-D-erythritol synthase [Bacteroidetes bacterium HGW-Bacteroidetes-18]